MNEHVTFPKKQLINSTGKNLHNAFYNHVSFLSTVSA